MANFVTISKNQNDNTYSCVIDDEDQDYQDIFSSINDSGLEYEYVEAGSEKDISGMIHNEPEMELYIDETGKYFGVIDA